MDQGAIRDLVAVGYFRLAKMSAEQDDRDGVLEFVKRSLEQRSPEVSVATYKQDELIRAWNNDEAFDSVYQDFAAPAEPDDSPDPDER
jgi:hypothetical protein